MAETYRSSDLGPVQSVHRLGEGPGQMFRYVIVIGVFLIGTLLFRSIACASWDDAKDIAYVAGGSFAVVLTVATLLAGVLSARRAIGLSIAIRERGITIRRAGRVTDLPWQAIDAVDEQALRARGRTFVLPADLTDTAALVALVKTRLQR